MKNESILILHEGQSNLLRFTQFLVHEGFLVHPIEKSSQLLDSLYIHRPSLVMLPVELSTNNGIDICFQLKSQDETAHIFVMLFSQKREEYTQIAGLESGADDFLFQPIQERVLLSRIKALLKRKSGKQLSLADSTLVIDQERYLILKEGAEIYLPKKEFEILKLLYSKPMKTFTREEIKARVWSSREEVRGRTIDVHVRNIREKLGAEIIRTVKGIGYVLELKG